MKKIILTLLLFASLMTKAQYVTSFAKNVTPGPADGVLYYLPQNVIRLDFIIEQTQYFKGPYSNFASDLLGVDNFIKEDKTSYSIKDVIVSLNSEPDPNAVFYISVDEKNKDSNGLNICLSDDGTISAFGYRNGEVTSNNISKIEKTIVNNLQEANYQYIASRNLYNKTDTVVRKFTIDTTVIFRNIIQNSEEKLTPLEKAKIIVEEIEKIRQSYYDLISGLQEVNYGTTINIMTDRLLNLENEYLSMFTGKTVKKIIEKAIYVLPEKGQENNNIVVAKFSENEGIQVSNAKGGETLKIQFQSAGIFANVNAVSKDALESTSYPNKLFYRIPGNVTMKVMYGNNQIHEERLKISQFGNLMLAPMNKMKLLFDPSTGQIISMTKEL